MNITSEAAALIEQLQRSQSQALEVAAQLEAIDQKSADTKKQFESQLNESNPLSRTYQNRSTLQRPHVSFADSVTISQAQNSREDYDSSSAVNRFHDIVVPRDYKSTSQEQPLEATLSTSQDRKQQQF